MDATLGNNKYVKQAKSLAVSFLSPYPKIKIYLFGSRAYGKARKTSDIDIALSSQNKIPAILISGLREAFEESTIPYNVDVVDLNNANSTLKRKVLKEGVLWKD